MDVLNHLVHDPHVSRVAALLLALLDAAERAERRAPGLVGVEPSRDNCVDLLLEMKPELVVELALDLAPLDERAQA